MIVLDAAATAAALPWEGLPGAVREVLQARSRGLTTAPQRLHLEMQGGGTLLVMPAADADLAVTKVASIHLGNPARGLPSVQADVLVLRAADGVRLGMLEGKTLTVRRTVALSLLAAQVAAPRENAMERMLLFGAGPQARGHLEAFARVFGVRRFHVVSRSGSSAQELAAWAREEFASLGLEVEAVAEGSVTRTPEALRELLPQVDLLVTATGSSEPLLSEADCSLLREEVFVSAVGGFTPETAELPAGLMRRAKVYVDTREGALHEAGDVVRAGLQAADITPLEEILDQQRPALVRGRPAVFKCVGHALFDLAAARLAFAGEL